MSANAFSNSKNFSLENSTIYNVGGNFVTYSAHADGQDEEIRKIANWLSPINFKAIQSDAFSRSTAGTGTGALESAQFQSWISGAGGRNLWGIGIPGAGKTILSSIAIEYLKARFSSNDDIAVVFAYCRYSDKHSVAEIMASLLKQLLEDRPSVVLTSIKERLYVPHHRNNTRPTEVELMRMFHELIAPFSKIYVVLDALDEFPEDYRYDLVDSLLSLDQPLLITSRPLHIFGAWLLDPITLEIKANDDDIQMFVSRRIERMPGLRTLTAGRKSVKDEIISKVQRKSNGMFLLAALQVDCLKGCTTLNSLRKALEQLPVGVDDMYRTTLARIEAQTDEESQLAKRAILWIAYASRSLSVEELREALAVIPGADTFSSDDVVGSDYLISVCCGVVTLDHESQTVRLIHYTAQDFFKGLDFGGGLHPHALIASACTSYLSFHSITDRRFLNSWDLRKFLSSQRLLEYAYHNWGLHAHSCDGVGAIPDLVHLFVVGSRMYPWGEYYAPVDYFGPSHLAARFGLTSILQQLPTHCDNTPQHQITPLHLASLHGHDTSVKFLLACNGVNVNAKDACSRNALIYASQNGHDGVVKRLLTCDGVDVNVKDVSGRTALFQASRNGHEEVVKLLLACDGVDTNAKETSDGFTALVVASAIGHEGVVKWLLTCDGVDVNAKDQGGNTALFQASQYGHEGVVKLLLAYDGVDTNVKEKNDGFTALIAASVKGHEGVVKSLLTCDGVDVNAKDQGGDTALIWACWGESEEVVKGLLACNGIDVNAKNKHGNTALHTASWREDKEYVKLLLSCDGIDVNAKDNCGLTALIVASREGYAGVVKQLLACDGVDVNVTGGGGETALIAASEGGHEAVVKGLLACDGIDVDAKREGETALTLAFRNRHRNVVRLLRAYCVEDISDRDDSSSP